MEIDLRRVAVPPFAIPEAPAIPGAEYERRAADLYTAVGLDWVAIYGDREHSANLLFACGFDPRFEEAVLLLGPHERRVLLVGNEGLGYAEVAGLPVEVVLYQPFSLLGQPRGDSPPLVALLGRIGIGHGARVGVAGWKYLDAPETDDPSVPAYVPAFLTRAIEQATGIRSIDVTAALMHPVDGLRARHSATQIAHFAWGAARASAAVLRVVHATRPGMSEREAIGAMGYQGEPLSCHPILATSDGALNGLRSPSERRIGAGDAATVGIGYWGGLCCRAGIVAATPDEAFLTNLVRPYFAAIATWWSTVGIGVSGGEIDAAVRAAIGDAPFRPLLNPGHLTAHDEWVHSPIRPGSAELLRSGMMLQCDIIPTPLPPGQAINCEDTAALADDALRAELARDSPALWSEIERRRAFMREALGIEVRPEVLPLSVAPAYLPPCWLDEQLVCVVRR